MANYTGSSLFVIPRPIAYKNGLNSESLADHKTLTQKDSMIQILENATVSAKTAMLPASKNGLSIWIKCKAGSANPINVNDPATGGTISTLAAGECGYFMSDGTNWHEVIKA